MLYRTIAVKYYISLSFPAIQDCALRGIHRELGHLGAEHVLSLARAKCFWPKMAMAIEESCKNCERCFRRKVIPQKTATTEHDRTESDSHDTRKILVITNHFTKFVVAILT